MCHIDEAAGLVPQEAHPVYPEGFTCGGHPENLGRSPQYWASEAAMTVDGKCLYVICRVLHAIAIFDVAADGSLALRGHAPLAVGSNARNLCVDPAGGYLLIASQDANAVESFRIGEDGLQVGLFGWWLDQSWPAASSGSSCSFGFDSVLLWQLSLCAAVSFISRWIACQHSSWMSVLARRAPSWSPVVAC